MDESVLRSMAKWPDVPAVYGWLALDRRGQWRIQGERVGNPAVSAFIGRNYACDEAGRWFFQNGPQRVFVDLDYTPWVLRVANAEDEPPVLRYHTGDPVASVSRAWMDEDGMLLLETGRGVGLVHDRDLGCLSPHFTGADGNPLDDDVLEGLIDRLRSGNEAPLRLRIHGTLLRVGAVRSADVPARFGFVPRPVPPGGAESKTPDSRAKRGRPVSGE